MKPYLVDYKKIIKPNPIPKIEPKIIKEVPININYLHIFFNLIGILSVVIGFYFLYSRNKEKEKNKEKYEINIESLNKKLNLIS
jgi:hypothetical protein